MSSRIKDLEGSKATLYRKLDSLEQERNALARKLGEAESAVSQRVDEIVKIKEGLGEIKNKGVPQSTPDSRTVELAPIIVHGKQEKAAPSLTARVLSVNKQNGFIIIDLGENSGVKANDRFSVYRDNKFIANIEVIMMRKDISAADIKEISVNEEIKVGDVVKSIN
jgi:seryl-tRNA synthetase